ncbi:MAG: TIGR03960 family B12-binding radical SAM protein [Fastidiosipila sp.]|nr:TIGR03960 family B12-binding radical SAM protein [Fastidiosipila sp.]
MTNVKKMQSRAVLGRVEKPSRYTGGEWNQIDKTESFTKLAKAERLHVAFCFPDIYEIGMSNLALQILYQAINARAKMFCERVFMPAVDMREIMQAEDILLESIESGTPLSDFDVLAFSLHYELSYTAVLEMLALAAIPFYAAEREESHPLIIAGGPITCNLEPMADFFDLILLGEGETVLPELLELYSEFKQQAGSRAAFLRAASGLEGIYVPGFYKPFYSENSFAGLSILEPSAPSVVKRRLEPNLDDIIYPVKPLVPSLEVVHDRAVLELFRGCSRGCRFCQAGYIYRPVRERSVPTLLEYTEKLLAATGSDELGLLSLSTSDYSKRNELMTALIEKTADCHVNLSLPSLRLDSFDFSLMEQVSGTRKAGLTFAPEAGTQRLRNVVNKNITEEDLLEACNIAFNGGWSNIKLYFMLGLPTETEEDVRGIADLCWKVLQVWSDIPHENRPRKPKITASISFFIPKPWTPFQWVEQITPVQMKERVQLLTELLRDRRISLQWHDYESSRIEGVLARGDRRLAPVIEKAWQKGSFLDAWHEYFSAERWDQALQECGLNSHDYTRERDTKTVLPWDHMDIRVSKRFLLKELELALEEKTTSSCMDLCSYCGLQKDQCGICLQWQRKPLSNSADKTIFTDPSAVENYITEPDDKKSFSENNKKAAETFKLRLFYERCGAPVYLAHLDMMRLFERALSRAHWPLAWSEQAYNPRPLMVFALPVGCGIETRYEPFELELTEKIDLNTALTTLNFNLPPGLSVRHAEYIDFNRRKSIMSLVEAADYEFIGSGVGSAYKKVFTGDPVIFLRTRKGKSREIDLAAQILQTKNVSEDKVRVISVAGSQDNMRPDNFLQSLQDRGTLTQESVSNIQVIRHAVFLSEECF